MKWRVVDFSNDTWEVEADHVMPGSAWLSFSTGPDPRTVGVDQVLPTEVARFCSENVIVFYPVEGADGEPMVEAVKRIDPYEATKR